MGSERKHGEEFTNQMDVQIQVLWSYVHQHVLTRLNISGESSRGELGAQLNWVSNIQGELVQGVHQLANAVDRKLIQNDQRSATQEGMIKELYTAMQELMGPIGKNRKENIQIHQKSTSVEQKPEGIDKVIGWGSK